MHLRMSMHLLSALAVFSAVTQLCSAANVTVNVGGTSTIGDGYGGDYTTDTLRFSPADPVINVGDTITFKNLGGPAHNVHADDDSFRCANGCDGTGGNGTPSDGYWTSTVTFTKAGIVKFHCDEHESMGMIGTITVNDTAAPPAGTPITAATSGSWYDPSQNGHGFSLQVAPGNLFIVYWFVYSPDGTQQAWVTGSGAFTAGSNTATVNVVQQVGTKFPPNFDETALTTTDWGTLTFTFIDCSTGTVTWNSKVPVYGTGTLPIAKIIGVDGLNCTN